MDTGNAVGNSSLLLDPTLWLLGLLEGMVITKHERLFVFYTAYYARREILLEWKSSAPPTVI